MCKQKMMSTIETAGEEWFLPQRPHNKVGQASRRRRRPLWQHRVLNLGPELRSLGSLPLSYSPRPYWQGCEVIIKKGWEQCDPVCFHARKSYSGSQRWVRPWRNVECLYTIPNRCWLSAPNLDISFFLVYLMFVWYKMPSFASIFWCRGNNRQTSFSINVYTPENTA